MLTSVDVSHKGVFHYFLSDDIKQDAATTATQSEYITELRQNKQLIFADQGTIWGKNDVCEEKYRCDTALYWLEI